MKVIYKFRRVEKLACAVGFGSTTMTKKLVIVEEPKSKEKKAENSVRFCNRSRNLIKGGGVDTEVKTL